jgi:hypothetical protein
MAGSTQFTLLLRAIVVLPLLGASGERARMTGPGLRSACH